MTALKSIPVDIFSDVICPWCLIGKRRLEKAVEQHGGVELAIRWRAFLLNPGMRREGMDRQAYIDAKFGVAGTSFYDRIASVGREAGIDFRFDQITRTPDSRPAHGLVLSAGDHADAVVEELFSAYFHEGVDIGDEAWLEALAKRHGIPTPASDSIRKQIDQDLKDAARLGIQGVPFFVFNGEMAISGAHPPESFLPLFDAVIAQSA